MVVSAAKADIRTLRIGSSDYVITTALKIQFLVVICVKDPLITRNLRNLPPPTNIILLLVYYSVFRINVSLDVPVRIETGWGDVSRLKWLSS